MNLGSSILFGSEMVWTHHPDTFGLQWNNYEKLLAQATPRRSRVGRSLYSAWWMFRWCLDTFPSPIFTVWSPRGIVQNCCWLMISSGVKFYVTLPYPGDNHHIFIIFSKSMGIPIESPPTWTNHLEPGNFPFDCRGSIPNIFLRWLSPFSTLERSRGPQKRWRNGDLGSWIF